MLQFNMIQAAKIIGTGLATIGAGIGIGMVFGGLILGVPSNPSLRRQLFSYIIMRFAFSEATRLFALIMGFLSLLSMNLCSFLFNIYVVVYSYFYTLYNRIRFECIVYKLKMLFIYYLDDFYSKHKVMVYLLMLDSIGIIFNVIMNPNIIHCYLFGLLVLSIGLLIYLVFFDTLISLNYPKTYIMLFILCFSLLIICFVYLSYVLLIELVKYIVNISTRPKPRVNYSENMSDDSSSKGGPNKGGPNGGGGNNDSNYIHETKKKNNKENKKRYNNSEKGKATNRAWHKSDKGQISYRKYSQSSKRKETRREWSQTVKGEQSIKQSRRNYKDSGKKEQTRKAWEQTEVGKKSTRASVHRYQNKRKGKALFDAVENA